MKLLKRLMRVNAASCILFGAIFLLVPHQVSSFIGVPPALYLQILGALLVFNGGHLMWASKRAKLIRAEVIWFSLGDLSWGIATFFLITTRIWIINPYGISSAVLIATGVVALGVSQLWQLRG